MFFFYSVVIKGRLLKFLYFVDPIIWRSYTANIEIAIGVQKGFYKLF